MTFEEEYLEIKPGLYIPICEYGIVKDKQIYCKDLDKICFYLKLKECSLREYKNKGL